MDLAETCLEGQAFFTGGVEILGSPASYKL